MLPDCINGCGCLIGEDIAANEDYQHVASIFQIVRGLPLLRENHILAVEMLKDAGILEDLALLSGLEITYHKAEEEKNAAADLREIASKRQQQKLQTR